MSLDLGRTSWSQISYTSSDSGSEGGGWGVKCVVGAPTDAVVALLRAGVTTKIEAPVELPDYPSTAELAERPRRLLYRPSGGRMALWHAVAAGADATGRPGNVYTHAIHQEAALPRLRPVELWRSAAWATPYGPHEVSSAELPNSILNGDAVSRDRTIDFVQDDDHRFTLEWLVAAAAHALTSGTTLVLGTPTPDEAAQWLGAISFFTSSAQARLLSWVTFERVRAVPGLRAQGLTIVCVPSGDIAAAKAELEEGYLVVDIGDAPDESDDVWTTASASFPRAPEWQNAVLDVCALERGAALGLLEQVDDLTLAMTEQEAALPLPLSWPLWMAMLGGHGQIARRASRVAACLAQAPESMADTGAIRALVFEVAASNEAYDELLALGPPNVLVDRVDAERTRRYLDGGWRSASPPVLGRQLLAPSADPWDAGVALEEAIDVVAGDDPAVVAAASRLIIFAVGHELDPPPDDDAIASVGRRAYEALLARLNDAEAPYSDAERADLLATIANFTAGTAPATLQDGETTSGDAPVVSLQSADPVTPTASLAMPAQIGVGEVVRPVSRSSVPAAVEPGHVAPPSAETDSIPPVMPNGRGPGNPMMTLLEAAEKRGASARAEGIADCVLLSMGVVPMPLIGPADDLDSSRVSAERALDQRFSPALSKRALMWLTRYWALAELGLLDGTPRSVPADFLRLADDTERLEAMYWALAKLVADLPAEIVRQQRQAMTNPRSLPVAASLLQLRIGPHHLGSAGYYASERIPEGTF